MKILSIMLSLTFVFNTYVLASPDSFDPALKNKINCTINLQALVAGKNLPVPVDVKKTSSPPPTLSKEQLKLLTDALGSNGILQSRLYDSAIAHYFLSTGYIGTKVNGIAETINGNVSSHRYLDNAIRINPKNAAEHIYTYMIHILKTNVLTSSLINNYYAKENLKADQWRKFISQIEADPQLRRTLLEVIAKTVPEYAPTYTSIFPIETGTSTEL